MMQFQEAEGWSRAHLLCVRLLNVLSHGLLGPFLAMPFWLSAEDTIVHDAFYGGFVVLFVISAIYHSLEKTRLYPILYRLDVSMIAFAIAASVTAHLFVLPFITFSLPTQLCLFFVWLVALSLILLVTMTGDEHEPLTIVGFIFQGTIPAVFCLLPGYRHAFEPPMMLVAGGAIAYLVGVAFFLQQKKNPYWHNIWHLAVLVGFYLHHLAVDICRYR